MYKTLFLTREIENNTINVLQEWFDSLEDGTANTRTPDFNYEIYFSDAEINELINKIDNEFSNELTKNYKYWNEIMSISQPPRFFRLEGGTRLAFVQDLHKEVKDWDIDE